MLLAAGFLWGQELRPCDDCLPGVTNFAKVDQALWRGGQPTAEGFKALQKAGVRTIISFRHDHDDAELLKGTGLRYLRLPSRAWHGQMSDLALFLKVMEDPSHWPVFVHCAQGRDRTGYNVAAYRMAIQGWSAERAIQEMEIFHFNAIWIGNKRFLRRLNLDDLRARVKAAPMPELRVIP
ncbi:MAG: tyrosine-protein phosphatase [Firmicutes bacterium]|nr:tyrosine-protein phosphatase [Bacillota bacterium]